jgi:hypothetical protein
MIMQLLLKFHSKSQVMGLLLIALMVSPSSFALQSNMDLTLDDNSGDSPKVILVDKDDKQLTMQKLDSGEGTLSNNEGQICLKPNNQSKSFCFANDGNNRRLDFDDNSGIQLSADGKMQYRDKNESWASFDDLLSDSDSEVSIYSADGILSGNRIIRMGANTLTITSSQGGNLTLPDQSIGQNELATDSVTSNKIVANAVTGVKIAANSVNSDKIENGTITNADISTSANIAGSKINPDFIGKEVKTMGSISGAAINATDDITVGNGKSLKLSEQNNNGSNTIALKAPDIVNADITLTLPNSAGNAGQVLKTDGSGVTSWTDAGQSLASTDQTLTGNRTIAMDDNTLTITSNDGSKLKLPNNSIVQDELAADSVTSGKIKDDTITNADISTSANIAGSKINPTFSASQQALFHGGLISKSTIYSEHTRFDTPHLRLENQNNAVYISPRPQTGTHGQTGETVRLYLPSKMGQDGQYLKIENTVSVATSGQSYNWHILGWDDPESNDISGGDITVGDGKSLKLSEQNNNGSNTIALKAPAAVNADVTLTLPSSAGTSGQVLKTDGSGVLSWTSPSAASISDGGLEAKKIAVNDTYIIVGDGSNQGTAVPMSGDVTISNTGATSIATNVIVNADVKSDAAIAGTKINPDFDDQNVKTTGSISGGDITVGKGKNVKLKDADGSNTIALKAPATVNTDITLTLPNSAGNAGQVLQTDGNGALSWTSPSAASISPGGLSPDKIAVTSGQIIVGNGSNQGAAVSMSGDVTIATGGATSIVGGVIVNADVNTGAAIAGSKIDPDFGGQAVSTTGNISGAAISATDDITVGKGKNVKLKDADGSNTIALKAPDSLGGNVTLTLPNSAGNAGQVLQTDGSGVTSWTSTSQSLASNNQTLTGNRTIAMGDNTLTITSSQGGNLKLPNGSIGKDELATNSVTSANLSDDLLITSAETTTAADTNILTALNITKRLPFGGTLEIGDIGTNNFSVKVTNKISTVWEIGSARAVDHQSGRDSLATITIANVTGYSGDLKNYTVSLAYEAEDINAAELIDDLRVPVIYRKVTNSFHIKIESVPGADDPGPEKAKLNVMIFPANDQT